MAVTCLLAGARLLGSWKNVEVHISQPPQLGLLSLLWFCLTLSRLVWGDDDARWNACVRTALKQRANNLGLVSERDRQTDRERESRKVIPEMRNIYRSVHTLGDMLAILLSSLLRYCKRNCKRVSAVLIEWKFSFSPYKKPLWKWCHKKIFKILKFE